MNDRSPRLRPTRMFRVQRLLLRTQIRIRAPSPAPPTLQNSVSCLAHSKQRTPLSSFQPQTRHSLLITPLDKGKERESSSSDRPCSTSVTHNDHWRKAPESTHTALSAARRPIPILNGDLQSFLSRPSQRMYERMYDYELLLTNRTHRMCLFISNTSHTLYLRHIPLSHTFNTPHICRLSLFLTYECGLY